MSTGAARTNAVKAINNPRHNLFESSIVGCRWKAFLKSLLLFLKLKTCFLQNINDSSRSHVLG